MNTEKSTEYTHGGNLEAARRRYGKKKFMDLSVNINPWGPSWQLLVCLIANLGKIREYPEPYSMAARKTLAEFFNLSAANFILGNGAAELIGVLPQVLPVERALILEPTFTEYSRAFEVVGKQVRRLSLTADFDIPLEAVASELKRGDLLFICQPNNPTGKLFRKEALWELLELSKAKQSWLVLDESFLWFCGEIRDKSFTAFVNDNPSLIIINSLTKIAAIPGLRLGFAVGAQETIGLIDRVLNQWNINGLAQKIIDTVLNKSYLERTCRRLNTERKWLIKRLDKLNIFKVYSWDANFYLARINNGMDVSCLVSKLADSGILVRDCGNFGGLEDNYIRIAVARRPQNRRLIKVLKRVTEDV